MIGGDKQMRERKRERKKSSCLNAFKKEEKVKEEWKKEASVDLLMKKTKRLNCKLSEFGVWKEEKEDDDVDDEEDAKSRTIELRLIKCDWIT